jgi:hypothetical protein
MRRYATWAIALAAAAGAVGCVPPGFVQPEPAPPERAARLPARPPVTPDEVGEGDAAAVVTALEDELDRAGADRPNGNPPAPRPASKAVKPALADAPHPLDGGIE